MKTALLLALAALGSGSIVAAEENSDYVPESHAVTETFTSKVLKVYSLTEGEGEYNAYVVTWKGHEVVIPALAGFDSRSSKTYAVGDQIRCRMQQTTHRSGDRRVSRIVFGLALDPGATGLAPADPAVEQARLEAIAAEVDKRRAIREAVLRETAAAARKRSDKSAAEQNR